MKVLLVRGGPAEMVREPRRLSMATKSLQSCQIVEVEGIHGGNAQRNSVLHNAILFEDPIEVPDRSPTFDHEVLGDDLEEVDTTGTCENLGIVRNAQAHTDPEILERPGLRDVLRIADSRI